MTFSKRECAFFYFRSCRFYILVLGFLGFCTVKLTISRLILNTCSVARFIRDFFCCQRVLVEKNDYYNYYVIE